MKEELSIEQAKKNLDIASNRWQEKHDQSRAASRAETAALNNLNNAQKAFDKVVDAIREDSAQQSEWNRKRNEVASKSN